MLTPVFILSLPRSGSTLLQRVLASHPDVASVAEPWILLPHVYTFRQHGIIAEYGHRTLSKAMGDFVNELPGGQNEFWELLRHHILNLYERAAKSSRIRYFVDKTPRYSLIASELLSIFPDAKFVILWRHPLAVAASIITTWGRGTWNLDIFGTDLFRGLSNLVGVAQRCPEQVLTVRYEQLVLDKNREWLRLFRHLDLEFSDDYLKAFTNVRLGGAMGDPKRDQYRTIDSKPVDAWRDVMATLPRKTWCNHYVRWIGRERLDTMGYDYDRIMDEVTRLPSGFSHSLQDSLRMVKGGLRARVKRKVLGL